MSALLSNDKDIPVLTDVVAKRQPSRPWSLPEFSIEHRQMVEATGTCLGALLAVSVLYLLLR